MRRAVVVLAAAALLLAGCTPPADPPADPRPAWDGIPITHPHVLLSCPDDPAQHLPADVGAIVEVRRCTADFHEVQGVLNKVQYVRRLTSDPAALLDAYAAPDEPPSDGLCGQPLVDPGILWLELDSGDVLTVRAPVDGCGHPLAAAQDASADAEFETILVAREVASTVDG